MRLQLTLALVFALVSAGAAAQDADAILGLWLTAEAPDGRAHVEVVKEGNRYAGKIVWLEKPTYPPDDDGGMAGKERVDRENPDPALHSRPIIGLRIFEGFEYAGNGLWRNGTIYDPANGKTYSCKIRLEKDGSLKVRGFIGISLLGRNEIWTRVAGAAATTGS